MAVNPEQARLAGLPIGNVLLIAPAGCGKTEALAARAAAALGRGHITAPRTILALTFSTKARDNLAERMRSVVGAGWHRRVLVRNFHGLAARVIRAHGNRLGIADDIIFPEEPWRRRTRNELGITPKNGGDAFEEALRAAKAEPRDDEEVMSALLERGNPAAIAYEERLRTEGRLDYDDLIRHSARILAMPEVSRLYQAHFAMTLVDEVQDLSIMQFDIVRAVGGDTVTYAGDPAQGIYSFAGAAPEAVFARIRALSPETVEFEQSYRSCPAVLRAVNSLAAEIGSTQLKCADPDRWPDEGHVISIERDDKDAEANAVLALVADVTTDPTVTVGVIGRMGFRMSVIRGAAQSADVNFEDWAQPTHVPAVVALLHRCITEAVNAAATPEEQLDVLDLRCRSLMDPADAEMHNDLVGAIEVLRSLVADGATVLEAVATCRPSEAPGDPVAPGVHILTGHKGKGQEFDWVIVVGLEGGHMPSFLAKTEAAHAEELRVLHVMASRARYGLAVTYVRHDGRFTSTPSPWLQHIRSVATRFDHE